MGAGSVDDRESVGSENAPTSCGDSSGGGVGGGRDHGNANRRRVPKVFSKESITKFRAWLFANLAVS